MNKFKVCTYYIKCENSDPIYEKIYNLSTKINKKYCELNNYNYSFDIIDKAKTDNYLDEQIFNFENHLEYKLYVYKYQYLLEQLEKSSEDYIVFIEYDACFCNDFKKLENYIDNQHDIFYARCNWTCGIKDYIDRLNTINADIKHNFDKITNFDTCTEFLSNENMNANIYFLHLYFFCTEGIFILKNNDISKQFLRAIVKYAPLFYDVEKCCIAQTLSVQFIMAKKKFINHIKCLPPQTQGHIYGLSNKYDENNSLICHNSSIDKNIVYNFLKNNIIKNKYWSKYF